MVGSSVNQIVTGDRNIFAANDVHVGFSAAEVEALLKASVAALPPPTFADLFECIREPEQVNAAIFRTNRSGRLAPYDVPHTSGRKGVADLQAALYQELLGSGGGLLVRGRSGLGKTREVAQLAMDMCAREWMVCLPRAGADARMTAPLSFPDDLRGVRLLLVLDDLHQRVVADSADHRPYVERLNALYELLDRATAPGEVYTIATVRSEPHHWNQLAYDSSGPLWGRFRIYELPEFSIEALERTLIEASCRAGVPLDATLAPQLVANSDRTPRTMLSNIQRAQDRGTALTVSQWLPTHGESWAERFTEARGRWTAAREVYEALHLIRQTGLPTRMPYVTAVASSLADVDATPATEGLVNMGLLGLRIELIDAFADEQLQDSLAAIGAQLPSMDGRWPMLRSTLKASLEQHPEWTADIVTLATRLFQLHMFSDAEADFTMAIEQGYDAPEVLEQRGFARYFRERFGDAEADFDAAIARGAVGALVYFGRGLARRRLEHNAQAEADLTVAIEHSRELFPAYSERAAARLELGDFQGTEADLTVAIEHGRSDAAVFKGRAIARRQQADYAGAEADFTRAIEHGGEDARVFFWRGELRGMLGDLAGAESDLSSAIEGNREDAASWSERGYLRLLNGDVDRAKPDLDAAIALGANDARVYAERGAIQLIQGKFAESEADLTASIERDQTDAQVYVFRSQARYSQHDFVGAELDCGAAIERGSDGADVYQLRALARIYTNRLDDALHDCEQATRRAPDDSDTHVVWGLWNLARGDYEEAIRCFDSVDANEQTVGRSFQRGLALLLDDRDEDARSNYSAGLQTASSDEIRDARWDLDFWTERQARGADAPSRGAIVSEIREQLARGENS